MNNRTKSTLHDYEQTKYQLHEKIVQCVKAIEQLYKVLKLFHEFQIVERKKLSRG